MKLGPRFPLTQAPKCASLQAAQQRRASCSPFSTEKLSWMLNTPSPVLLPSSRCLFPWHLPQLSRFPFIYLVWCVQTTQLSTASTLSFHKQAKDVVVNGLLDLACPFFGKHLYFCKIYPRYAKFGAQIMSAPITVVSICQDRIKGVPGHLLSLPHRRWLLVSEFTFPSEATSATEGGNRLRDQGTKCRSAVPCIAHLKELPSSRGSGPGAAGPRATRTV